MTSKLTIKASIFLLFIIFICSNHTAYAETYRLEIDENVFDIEYDLDGDIIAMATDKETISLLIATENVEDSEFAIKLPNDLIRAENNEFAVLVNGFEVEYDAMDTADSHLTFFIPAFTEEIEIIGTYVVPEFPLGAIMLFGAASLVLILVQKSKKSLFK
ncbi:MAG TPA: hypothetical protein VLA01_01100 [Nitrosopumilaceae archaeon]|nr:hypothetical protein [Nitrosopumilaceae archaeon]